MDLETVLDNSKKVIENLQNTLNEQLEKVDNFFETKFGQIIDNAIDFGLKEILPDSIENEVIEVKNSLIEGGIQEGITKAIEVSVEKGKELLGINENTYNTIEDIKNVIKEGNLKEGISKVIDETIDKIQDWGLINENMANLIKNGKDIILNETGKKIEVELENQENILSDLDESCSKWENALEKGYSFNTLTKHYKNVIKELEDAAPLKETIQKAVEIKNQYELIKSKYEDGDELTLSDEEKELCKKFAN